MQKDVRLPQVELNMERVQVVRWLVDVGELVAVGQPILEVETQKATVEVPSMDAGFVRLKCVSDSDEIGEGAILCVLTDNAEEPFEGPDAAHPQTSITAPAVPGNAGATELVAKPTRIVPAAPAALTAGQGAGRRPGRRSGQRPEGAGDRSGCARLRSELRDRCLDTDRSGAKIPERSDGTIVARDSAVPSASRDGGLYSDSGTVEHHLYPPTHSMHRGGVETAPSTAH